MPTGYTEPIESGEITTGKEFLMRCTRAFGVAMEIRDEPLSVKTPTTFEPSRYVQRKYDNAVQNLEKYQNYSFDKWKAKMIADHEKDSKEAQQSMQRMKAIDDKYYKVRKEVEKWNPPTESHAGIKKFALEQIDMCITSQSFYDYLQQRINSVIDCSDEAVIEYKTKYLESLLKDVERAQSDIVAEKENAKDKTRFMKQFLESIENL